MTPARLSLFRVFRWAVGVFLGAFYLVAGAVKIVEPGKFAEAIANYRIVPYSGINFMAITLPWIEVLAGLFLIIGLWRLASAWLINAMTVVFIVAIASAVARGLNIDCGCFGTVGGRRVGERAIAEDVGLLLAGLWVVWSYRVRAPEARIIGQALPAQAEPPAHSGK